LPTPITSGYKFFGTDQHIYLVCEKNKFIGFIKVGYKHLFIYDEIGVPIEINPLCVLDFYTYESCQRKGYGKIMFSEMLSKEKIEPKKMGFDRPSPKFLNFLNKYYGLYDYVPQNNNFVVFKDYFVDVPAKKDKYEIYNNNYNNNYSNNNNNNYSNSNTVSKNILSQRKLGKYSKANVNDNNQLNNLKTKEMSQKDKEFTSRIYKEYYNSNENPKKENREEDNYKYNQKKSFGYNQYQSTSSEYGAFFHMNK
jgi:GNAT superfamily N-acetyltransferase